VRLWPLLAVGPDAHRQDAVGSRWPQLMGDWVHRQAERLECFDAEQRFCAFGLRPGR
jgi:hypothetical protein